MRLIDADKLENDIAENITVKAVSRMLAITQGQPTVEAIPIEWIENYIWGADTHEEKRALRKMYIAWEKENANDKT